MSLIDDLTNLDLSGILQARLDISASLGGDGFKVAVSGDLESVVLGDLGDLIKDIKSFDPTNLEDTWNQLLKPILDRLDLDEFPLDKLLTKLKEGLEMGGSLLRQFTADPLSLGTQVGLPLGDLMTQFQNAAKNVVNIPLDDVQSARQIWKDLQQGLSLDPPVLAQEALSLLLPYPVDGLKNLRSELDRLSGDLKAPVFDPKLVEPMRDVLTRIRIHAEAGDQAALDLALAEYGTRFTSFQTNLNAACQSVAAKVNAWNLDALRQPAEALFEMARTGKPDGLAFMADLKRHLGHFELLIEQADADKAQAIMAKVHNYLDSLDAFLKTAYLDRIDDGIEFLKSWVRELFAPLKLRVVQGEINQFFDKLVAAINDADLGSYADVLAEPFKALAEKLEGLDIGGHLDQQLQSIGDSIGNVVQTIQAQLQTIDTALTGLIDQVTPVFEKLADLLDEFGQAVEEVNKGIENLDIEGVTEEVIKAIQELREKGEELIAQAPLPEPMKPLIEQLIKQLENMDLESLIKDPANDALAAFDLPDAVKMPLQNAMPELQKLLSNVMPGKLIAELQAELEGHFQTIIDLATQSIGDLVEGFFGELTKAIDVIDPAKLVDLLRIPFLKILEVFDRLEPEKLLKPVTQAYDDFLADLPLTDPAKAAKSTQDAIGKTGKAIGEAAAAPVKAAASPGKVREWKPEENISQPELPELKPGDIIRQLLGKPLQTLKDALTALDESKAAQFAASFQTLTGGLAKDIRWVQSRLSGLQSHLENSGHQLMIDLANLEFDAHYAVSSQIRLGNLSVDTQVQVFADFNTSAMTSDLSLSLETHRGQVLDAVQSKLNGLGEILDGIADLLENHRVTKLGKSLASLVDAVDPEPIAAAIDSIAQAALGKFVELYDLAEDEFKSLFTRIQQMIRQYNPALQLQRLSDVMAVFWEEMALLNPHFWVTQVKPIHEAVRTALSAYDPANWTADLLNEFNALKTKVTSIDPTSLIDPGQLNPFKAQADAVAVIDLTTIGQDLQLALGELTEGLADLDPAMLLDTVTHLKERILAQLDPVVDAIHQEILTLLKSLRYVTTQVSASASVSI